MDNDNEISTIQNPDVRLFLNEEMVTSVDKVKPSTYDFEEEYEKIRKRKSHTVSIILVSTIVVVVLFVVVFSIFIEREDSQVAVRIDAFEDLNLQSLLDELDRIDVDIQDKTRAREMFSKNHQYALDTLELNNEAEFFTIASMDLEPDVLNQERAALMRAYNAEITRVTDEYNAAIVILNEEIDILQAEYDDLYDPAIFDTEVAKSNSQRAVFDLEKQDIIDGFNGEIDSLRQRMATQQREQLDSQLKAVADVSEKYQYDISLLDPAVQDELVNALVTQVLETEFILPNFTALRRNEFITREELLLLDETEKLFTDYNLISAYLTVIPHENSIKDYSIALQNINAISATEYDNLFISLMETKRLAKVRIDGIILEATNQYNKLKEDTTNQYNTLESDFNVYKTIAEQYKTIAEQYKTQTEQELSDYQIQMEIAAEKETMKNQYEAYLSFISLPKLGDGFVMNAFDKDSILVFITPSIQKEFEESEERLPVYIFSGTSKTLLGQGFVTRSAGAYYLEVEDTSLAQRIFMDDIISLESTL